MKSLLWIGAALSLGLALIPQKSPPLARTQASWTVLAGGSVAGYLSPCGCVKPMSGGIRRRASAYREAAEKGPVFALEIGPLSGGITRQDEIKAETLAQALDLMDVDAVSLGSKDAGQGRAVAASLSRLMGARLVSTGLPGALDGEVREEAEKGPFLAGSWDPGTAAMARELGGDLRTMKEALSALADQAKSRGLASILMLEGGLSLARQAAEMEPSLGLIIYQSDSNPPLQLARSGRTVLATPGPKGKAFLRIRYEGGAFTGLEVVDLGPEHSDDSKAASLFREYQQRVAEEKLIDLLPRVSTPGFAGTKACISCHAEAGKVWAASRHAMALKTLEDDGADRDPECAPCHVVGMDSEKGFRSRSETPGLANVGCESCHGPGADHAMQPFQHKMPKAGPQSCQSCHVPDHSPGFKFDQYWPKIAH